MNKNDGLYKIAECNVSDLTKDAMLIDRIYQGDISGFIVQNFFNADEVTRIKENYYKHKHRHLNVDEGFIGYPMGFAAVAQTICDNESKLQEYFIESQEFRKNFATDFGVDIEEKMQKIVSSLTYKSIAVPTGNFGQGSYTHATFRELLPNKGKIKAHCENYFFEEFPNFFQKLSQWIQLKNQLSYFIVIQTPDKGGELTLYDAIWDNITTRLTGDIVLVDKEGKRYNIEDNDEILNQKLSPKEGSLLIFAGGQIWHRVEEVMGTKSRLTLGGFMSLSHDGKTIYYWS
jgi:hypothetical protein